MAKKGDIDLDQINLDDFDFDIPEFQDDNPVSDKSRSPAGRVTTGIIKGAKDEVASLAGMRKALMFALPSGYGLAADTIEDVSSDVRSLYDKITGEQPDLIRGGKSFGRKAMATIGNRALPKKLADRLNNAFEKDDDYKVKSSADYKREQEESDLAGLAEIFKAKGSVDEERAKQDSVNRLEDRALEQVRFKTNVQALTSINKSMARLVGYQDKVTARYQQKMLELTYRHYATTRQMNDMMTESMSKHSQILEKIRHNTALPEAVKIRGSEMFKQMAHQRLMGSGLNTVSNFTQNYGKQVIGNVSGMIQGIIDPLRDASQATDMEGIDRVNLGGQAVGSAIGSGIRDYAAIHAAPFLARNKTIARGGEKLRNAFTGLPQRVNEYAQSETEGTGFRSTMTQMFKQFLPKYQQDNSTGVKAVSKLDEIATFDSIARRSLIEIIPGYLSEIAHWSKIAVTGEKNAEKQVYNVTRGGFTSEKENLSDVGRQIFTRSERESLRSAAEDFLKEIGGDTMSGRAQRALKQKILDELANGLDLVPSRLIKREQYVNVPEPVVDEIVSLIGDTFNIDEDGRSMDDSTGAKERFNGIREKFLNMSSMIPAIGDRIRIFSDVLGLDSMRKLGYVERNAKSRQDNINTNRAWSDILDEDDEDSTKRDEEGRKDASDKSTRAGRRGNKRGKGNGDLTRRADRADDMASNRLAETSRLGGLEKYLGDKSTLITLVRESRDFHSETVELLKQLTNCSCDGVGGSKSDMDWKRASKDSLVNRFAGASEAINEHAKKSSDKLGQFKATAQDIWIQGDDHPALEEWRMKAGQYRDKATGVTIKKWGDIKGDVVDVRDKTVARYNDLMENAVVVNGKGKVVKKASELFASFKMSQAGAATQSAATHVSAKGAELSSFASKEGRKFKPRVKKMMKFFTGEKAGADISSELTGNHEDDMLTIALRSVQLQYQTLKEVTQEKVRKGSYKDLWARRKEIGQDAKDKVAGKFDNIKGLFGKGGALAGLLGAGRGEGDGEDDEGGGGIMDTIGDLMGGGDSEDGRRRRGGRTARRRAGRTGRLGKIANWGGRQLDKMGIFGKAVKGGAKATKGLGKAAWWLTKNTAKLGWGAAKFGGRMLGSQALRTGAAFAGRMALGALLGAAGLVSAPVLAGVAVVGGVIAVGSIIYNMSKDELPPLTRLRMAQYGIKPEADSEKVKQLLALEKLFAQGTSVDSENKAKLDTNSIPLNKIAEIFKIDMKVPMEENDAMRRLSEYLKGRFSAVFLAHVSNYYALTKSLDLAAVDSKVTGKAALEFLGKVAMKDQSVVFDAMVSPFDDDDLDMDSGDVEDVYDDAKELIEEAIKKGGDTDSAAEKHADAVKKGIVAGTSVAVGTGVAATTASAAKKAELASSGKNFTGGGKATAESVGGAVKASAILVGGAAGATVMVAAAANMQARSTELDDGKSIRYRAYGLTDMSESKIGHLSQLEGFCYPLVTYSAEGQATLKDEALAYAEAEKIFSPVGEEAENVYVWFHRRFLPVFLTYCTEVRARANIDAADASKRMKPSDFLEVLRATVRAHDSAGIPVWDIDSSPWNGYYMNDEPESVNDALYSLSLKIKDKTVTESTVANKGRTRGPDGEYTDEDPNQTNKPASASNSSSGASGGSGNESGKKDEPGILGNLWNGFKSAIGIESKTPQSPSTQTGGGGATGPTSISGGLPVNHPGGGSGGSINDIPQPTGTDWQSNAATIMAAANMVGVDPSLAASIAGVESGYNPTARPWSKKEQRYLSSAAGYFQVINDTWKELMGKYGSKYGIDPNATQMDPRANALLGLEYIRENTEAIGGVVKRGVTDTDVYLGHFLGTGGAKRFLAAPQGDAAINHVGADQADANKAIFYDRGGRPRTVAAVWSDFDAKLKKHRQPDAPQIAATARGAPLPVEAVSTETPAAVAAALPSDTPSLVKGTDTTSTTSANTVAEASAPSVDQNLATKADERQVNNSTATLAVSARIAEAQSSNQAKASADTYGGMDKGMSQLLGVNEAQLEQLITLVTLMRDGNVTLPNASGPATNLVASTKTTQNPSINTAQPAKQSTVSVARA